MGGNDIYFDGKKALLWLGILIRGFEGIETLLPCIAQEYLSPVVNALPVLNCKKEKRKKKKERKLDIPIIKLNMK